jgi:hypothetical protein
MLMRTKRSMHPIKDLPLGPQSRSPEHGASGGLGGCYAREGYRDATFQAPLNAAMTGEFTQVSSSHPFACVKRTS